VYLKIIFGGVREGPGEGGRNDPNIAYTYEYKKLFSISKKAFFKKSNVINLLVKRKGSER
jgi:hypothetical protein